MDLTEELMSCGDPLSKDKIMEAIDNTLCTDRDYNNDNDGLNSKDEPLQTLQNDVIDNTEKEQITSVQELEKSIKENEYNESEQREITSSQQYKQEINELKSTLKQTQNERDVKESQNASLAQQLKESKQEIDAYKQQIEALKSQLIQAQNEKKEKETENPNRSHQQSRDKDNDQKKSNKKKKNKNKSNSMNVPRNNNNNDDGDEEKERDVFMINKENKNPNRAQQQLMDNHNDHKKSKNKKKNKNRNNNNNNKRKKEKEELELKMKDGIVGLSNLGNTCFMNSALQCLLQCPGFVQVFFKMKLPKIESGRFRRNTNKKSISHIWSLFVKEIYSTNYSSISPRAIKNGLNQLNPDIGNGSQEDAFCVIETLLQGLDEDLSPSNSDGIYHELHIMNEQEHAESEKKEQEIDDAAEYDDGILVTTNENPSKYEIDSIANKLWSRYINQSNNECAVIRQLFDGMECEILTCPDCNYQLRAFQHFRHIELPLVNKNITINIKVYIFIPEIEAVIPLKLTIAYDNTVVGLKCIVLLQEELQKYNINKDKINISFGYIHQLNNDKSNNVNSWIKYMNDNDNCANIIDSSLLFAIITNKDSKYQCIPTFNLICDENDKYVNDIIDLLTFTKVDLKWTKANCNEFINYVSNIPQQSILSGYDAPMIYFDNHLVTDNKNNNIEIKEGKSLLRIWIHSNYPEKSPKTVNLNLDKKDRRAPQNVLRGEENVSIVNAASNQGINSMLSGLSGILSFGYSNPQNIAEDQQQTQNHKKNAQSIYGKFRELTDSEKLANKWLLWKINQDTNNYEKNKINITKPKLLDNLVDCLKAYEMKMKVESNEPEMKDKEKVVVEISDGNGIDCQRCADCPEIASRQVEILRTPQILTIHIDREQVEFDNVNSSKKRDNLIKYPICNLKFVNDNYDLFGVVEHYGFGTDWGHYVCYVKSLQNPQNWYKMNDSSTSKVINKTDIITKDASILLYHKQLKKL